MSAGCKKSVQNRVQFPQSRWFKTKNSATEKLATRGVGAKSGAVLLSDPPSRCPDKIRVTEKGHSGSMREQLKKLELRAGEEPDPGGYSRGRSFGSNQRRALWSCHLGRKGRDVKVKGVCWRLCRDSSTQKLSDKLLECQRLNPASDRGRRNLNPGLPMDHD